MIVTILGRKYELGPHPDGQPGLEAFPLQVWQWPGEYVEVR